MTKSLFKTCPKCGYKKCWIKAKMCEECCYDFALQRKPRSRSVATTIEDDDEPVVLLPPPPKETHKICPGCKNKCWHKAPVCEVCEWDFRTNLPKEVISYKQAAARIEVPKDVSYFGRRIIVYAPATGGYGSDNAKRNAMILKIKPPESKSATYDSVSYWIYRLQQYGLNDNQEYSESACRSLVRDDPDGKIKGFIKQVFVDLVKGIPLTEELEAPKNHKFCLRCGHVCWHKASACEECDYRFI